MSRTATRTRRVFVFGSAHEDLVLSVPQLPTDGETVLATGANRGFGGKGANQAIAAAAAGASVVFIGTLGTDESGSKILANFADHGIDTSWTRRVETEPTGMAVVMVDSAGRNQIVVASGAGVRFEPEVVGEVMRVVGHGDVIVVQCEIPVGIVESILRGSAATGALCILNLAPYMPVDAGALAASGLIIVNESEAASLINSSGIAETSEPWSAIAGALGTSTIVTLGERGSVFSSPDGELIRVASRRVDGVVDTTGAGDVYVGTLGALVAAGVEMPVAMAEASNAASTAVLSRGAQARRTQPTVAG
jgi:ribokinase